MGNNNAGYAGVYHERGATDWEGSTGYYFSDFRASLAEDESKIWSPIHLWATPNYSADEMYITFEPASWAPPNPTREYVVELEYVPDGMNGAPVVGTRWLLPTEDTLSIAVPTYTANDGAGGYRFSFTISAVVPEPTATIGLLLGLFLRRRR